MKNEGKNKEKKYLSGIILNSFLISMVSTLGIIGVMVIIDKLNIGTAIGVNLKYNWLGLIGTCITIMVSVNVPIYVMIQTLRYQKEKDDLTLRLNIMPVINCKVLLDADVPEGDQGRSLVDIPNYLQDGRTEKETHYIFISLENVGVGNATNCNIFDGIEEELNTSASIPVGTTALLRGEKRCVSYVIELEKRENLEFQNITFELRYKDYLNNQYRQRIGVGISLNRQFERENGESYFKLSVTPMIEAEII